MDSFFREFQVSLNGDNVMLYSVRQKKASQLQRLSPLPTM
uniref:Uncharacterized protein n=1 Tax=Photobacterium damselae subsp. damselae TaxID=85581 RepID=E4WLG1_PHODD|nr:hypothetical protein [Photobacterium damselae subsp. damselae]